jgi:hypothetical protein
MKWKRQGKTEVFAEKCVLVQLCPTTNRTWTGVVSTAALRGEKCGSSDDNPLFTNWLNITKPKTSKCKMNTWKTTQKRKERKQNSINNTRVKQRYYYWTTSSYSNFSYSEVGSIILYRKAASIYRINQCHNTADHVLRTNVAPSTFQILTMRSDFWTPCS